MKTTSLVPPASFRPEISDLQSHTDPSDPSAYRLELKNILVPLDFSEASFNALRFAIPLARQFGATLTLLHVVDLPAYTPELPYPPVLPPDHHEAVARQLEEIHQKKIPDDLTVKTVVRHDFVFNGILEVARNLPADLIITTTHGHTGLMHMLLGSTAESVVRKAPCPVLVVRDVEKKPAGS